MRLHVRQTQSGHLTATNDIIDQGIYGVPCTDVVFSGRHLSFAIPAVDGKYEGELSPDGHTITGLWTQGESRQLVFTRKEPETKASLDKQLNQIDAMVSETFAKRPVGSVTIGVVSQAHLVWSKSYGAADMANHIPANPGTIYRIGSLTKMFTAIMLDQLVEAGTVRLSDPVNRYFPEIDSVQDKRSGTPPITMFQLATHTSGLAREPEGPEWNLLKNWIEHAGQFEVWHGDISPLCLWVSRVARYSFQACQIDASREPT